MKAEHQVVEKGVFFISAIKLDVWEPGRESKVYLVSGHQGGIDLGEHQESN